MNILKFALKTTIFVTVLNTAAVAQMTDMTVFQSNMRSKAANQFYQEDFQKIGSYKVKGNSYLFKGNNVTDIYATIGFGTNLPIVFDTYTQKVSILQENRKDIVALTSEELDSFVVKIDKDINNSQPAVFINASRVEAGKKMYLQKLTNGSKFNLYKSYYSELRPAAMDVAQTNVREFEIVSEYYYLDMADKTSFIKIKPNNKSLKELFKEQKPALAILEGPLKQQEKLVAFFTKINE